VRRASLFPTRIILAADGSEDAQRAIKTALGLSTNLESELHVVYVAPEHPYCTPTTTCAIERKKNGYGEETSES
jgi:K+-sensing histidine kinase KdpD